jgi:hypothetical protein
MSYNSYWTWYQNGTNIYGNLPKPRNHQNLDLEIQSACANSQYSPNYGFSCPHMLMLSDDMVLASKYDNNFNNFHYAVAGGYSDDECGKCYQVKLIEAENIDRLPKKQLIIQVINSGYDVNKNQWDILMGGGGFGYYTACNSDCSSMYCLGGPCNDHLYLSVFDDWVKFKSKSSPYCYIGTDYTLDLGNHTLIYELCKNLVKETFRIMDNMTIDSCYRSYIENFHQNFIQTEYIQVQCPEGLYRLTGLRRQDDLSFQLPNINNTLTEKCIGNLAENKFCLTTMQDCCKPSCAWNYKGYPSQIWSKVDTCDHNGKIINYL